MFGNRDSDLIGEFIGTRSRVPIYKHNANAFILSKRNSVKVGSATLPLAPGPKNGKFSSEGEGVVINAGFSLLPGIKTSFKAKFEPSPAHIVADTNSARLSAQISNFLERSDHISEHLSSKRRSKGRENNASGRSSRVDKRLPGSESLSLATMRSMSESLNSLNSIDLNSCFDIPEIPDKNEDIMITPSTVEKLSEAACKPEIKVTAVNGIEVEEDEISANTLSICDDSFQVDEDVDEDAYKQRWKHSTRELKILKDKLATKEKDYCDQILFMKKCLEKKYRTACEETFEQRQIVMKLKKKLQDMSLELNRLKTLLQDENSKCVQLEHKKSRLEAELTTLRDRLSREKLHHEITAKERDVALNQLMTLENEISILKSELKVKECQNIDLICRLKEAKGSESELQQLLKAKQQLQHELKKKSEELEQFNDIISELQKDKEIQESTIEELKKIQKAESLKHDEELEELRDTAVKRIKALELQISNQLEERANLICERKELELKYLNLDDVSYSKYTEEDFNQLKKKLKFTKVLLKDSRLALEEKSDLEKNLAIKKLQNQMEQFQLERQQLACAKEKAVEHLNSVLQQLEEIQNKKAESDSKLDETLRENYKLKNAMEEAEEQYELLLEKYKSTLEELTATQSTATDQALLSSDLHVQNSQLKDKVNELNIKLDSLEKTYSEQSEVKETAHQLELKEYEGRLKLEKIKKARIEKQISKIKDHLENAQNDNMRLSVREKTAKQLHDKAEKKLRNVIDETKNVKETEKSWQIKQKALETQLGTVQLENKSLRNQLKLSLKRIEQLSAAMNAGSDNDDSDDEIHSINIDDSELD